MKNVKSMLCTLVVCTIFSLNTVNAQYQIDRNYSAKTIYLQGNKYVKDGLEYPNGFLHKQLKKEMEISPNAVIEYQRFEKKRNLGLFMSVAGLAGVIASASIDNQKVRNGVLLGSLGSSLISLPIAIKSTNHFQKSIWIRNGDALGNE